MAKGRLGMEAERYPLFSNGTEFEIWQSRNCDRCIKAVSYNEKTDTWPKYRCAIQKHIEEACVGDGRGNRRDYEACSATICPHIKTEWPQRKKTAKKDKSLTLNFEQ